MNRNIIHEKNQKISFLYKRHLNGSDDCVRKYVTLSK